jgi:hypothetical protein
MFGSSKPVVLEPYSRRRSRRLMPRWLVLLLTGAALGVGGVILVQERHLPPRLSAAESAQLRSAFEEAESDRQRLKLELVDTTKRLETALGENKQLSEQLSESRQAVEDLRNDVGTLVASLPPDPRGGAISVRAARITTKGQKLDYDVVLSRDRASAGKPLTGVMRLVVAGDSARGPETKIASAPIAISVGAYESLRGSLPLPEGFKPRQTTISLQDRVDGKQLGMRVVYVK